MSVNARLLVLADDGTILIDQRLEPQDRSLQVELYMHGDDEDTKLIGQLYNNCVANAEITVDNRVDPPMVKRISTLD